MIWFIIVTQCITTENSLFRQISTQAPVQTTLLTRRSEAINPRWSWTKLDNWILFSYSWHGISVTLLLCPRATDTDWHQLGPSLSLLYLWPRRPRPFAAWDPTLRRASRLLWTNSAIQRNLMIFSPLFPPPPAQSVHISSPEMHLVTRSN